MDGQNKEDRLCVHQPQDSAAGQKQRIIRYSTHRVFIHFQKCNDATVLDVYVYERCFSLSHDLLIVGGVDTFVHMFSLILVHKDVLTTSLTNLIK